MKRRLLSAFLAVMMVLTMAPVAFAADEDADSIENPAATITVTTKDGTTVTSYETLQAAVNAAVKNNVIVLQKDITENVTIPSTLYNVTIDLNGKRWSGGTDVDFDGNATIHQDKAALTNYGAHTYIKDSVGTGVITRDDTGVKMDANPNTSYYVIDNIKGVLTIQGGTIYNDSDYTTDNGGTDGSSVIRNGGVAGQGSPVLTIAGGHVYQDDFIAVKNDEYGTLWVTGGTVESQNSTAILNWKTATIKKTAQVNGVINTLTYKNTKGQTTIDGTATVNGKIAADKYDENTTNAPEVLVTGGNLDIMWAIGDATVQVTGGTFTTQVPAAYYGDGYEQTEVSGGYTVSKKAIAQVGDKKYTTMDDAFHAAVASGETLTLLRDYTTASLQNSGSKSFTIDLNGHTWTYTSKDTNSAAFEINYPNVTLTVKNGKIISSQLVGLIPSARGGTITYNNSGLVFENIEATANGTSGIESNGMNTNDVVTLKNSTLNVPNGFGIYFPSSGAVTIEDSTITAKTMGVQVCAGNLNVKNSTITVTGSAVNKTENDGAIEDGAAISVVDRAGYKGLGKVNIESGKFTSIKAYKWDNSTKQETAFDNSKNVVAVSGGVFAQKFDNSYCAIGLTVVSNEDTETNGTYPWTVGTIKAENVSNIETGSKVGTTKAEVTGVTGSENIAAAKKVAENVKPAEAPTESTPITDADKTSAVTALVNAGHLTLTEDKKIPSDTQVMVVKKIYFDVKLTNLNMNNGTTNPSFTVDITPKYDLVAVSEKNNTKNEVVLKSNQNANVDKATISVILPSNFVTDTNTKVYVLHTKNGTNYMYNATITQNGADYIATFDDPHGFSEFKLVTTLPVATITKNGVTTSYDNLKEAAAAANDGDEIIVNSGASHEITFNTTKSVKVTNKTDNKITVKFNGTNKDVAKDATETFSYTKPSSGGSSGGSSSGKMTYKVTTSAVNNGGVNASPSNAEKGAAITITLSPDKGYKLDKLTVTDGSGKTVSTVKKSDTVYTFTMPASAVTVGVSYVKATETPSETKFNDVSANDWFASAVDYVTGKGMMNGTADNTFSPKANTTRGMVVTVLYRLENQPSTSAASFTDVASGAYYANAVAWANANGIVSGYGSGKFGPNDKVTREQLAAILYRYAQYKKYDVSVGEDTNILSYDDAQSISSYAIPAIQWACGAGVVTGKSVSKLDPKGNATRAEVAAMLMRFCENVK